MTLKSNAPLACYGCSRATKWTATGYECPVWAEPHKVHMIRVSAKCYFNQPVAETAKQKQINFLKASKRAARGR